MALIGTAPKIIFVYVKACFAVDCKMPALFWNTGVQSMTNEELAAQIQDGENNLALELWEKVRGLILYVARRYLPPDKSTNRIELDDLMQAGYIAMIEAVKNFNRESGYAFTAFLYYPIKAEFARLNGIKSSKRDALLHAVSIDEPLTAGDDELTISDLLEDEKASEEYENLIESSETRRIAKIALEEIKKLNERQEEIIMLHYFGGLSLSEIGRRTGVTRERIRQLECKGMGRLRNSKAISQLINENRASRYYVDENTDFYRCKGVAAFNSSGSSVVEDLTEYRQRLWGAINDQ